MKTILAAIAMTIAVPAAAQGADPHAQQQAQAAPSKGKSASDHSGHMAGCHKMADGKMMGSMMMDGKMMDCSRMQAKGDAPADPHAGHNMGKK